MPASPFRRWLDHKRTYSISQWQFQRANWSTIEIEAFTVDDLLGKIYSNIRPPKLALLR
jgi:hypothetical protein